MRYNSVAFTLEECEKGLHLKFIENLLTISKDKDKSYFDIHISSDGYCTIVDFYDVSFDYEAGKFEFVEEDEEIMKWIHLPDNTSELVDRDTDQNEYIENWLKENPGWVKTEYGTWTNEIENKKFREEFELDESDGDK